MFCAFRVRSDPTSLCKDALVFAPPKPLYYGQIQSTMPPTIRAVPDRKGRVHYGTSLQLQRGSQHAARKSPETGTGRAARIRRQRPERDGDEPPQQVVRRHHHRDRSHPAPGDEHPGQLQGRFLSGRCDPAVRHGAAELHDHRQGRLHRHRQLLQFGRKGSRKVRRGQDRRVQQG